MADKQDDGSAEDGAKEGALALLAGYSDVDSDENETVDNSGAADAGTVVAEPPGDVLEDAATALPAIEAGTPQHAQEEEGSGKGKPQQAPASEGAQGPATEPDLDLELASFFGELEASGLLDEKESAAAAESGAAADDGAAATAIAITTRMRRMPTPAPDGSAAAEARDATSNAGADAASAPSEDVAMGNPGEVEQQQQAEELQEPEQQQQPAEQRMLGYLQQDPKWAKCLDTGDHKIYYWHLDSGEVCWEPPPGLDGELLLPAEGDDQEQGGAKGADEVAGPGDLADAKRMGEGGEQRKAAVVQEHGPAAESAQAGAACATPVPEGTPEPMGPEAAPAIAPQAAVTEPGAGATGAAGPVTPTAADGSSAAELQDLLLRAPQPHIDAVMTALEAEAALAARAFLHQLPPLVRLAVEAEVRAADWKVLKQAQADAVAAGQPAGALTWPLYERHTMTQVKALLEALPLAAQQAHYSSQGQPAPAADGGASHASAASGSAVPAAEAAAAGGEPAKVPEVPERTSEPGVGDADAEEEMEEGEVPSAEELDGSGNATLEVAPDGASAKAAAAQALSTAAIPPTETAANAATAAAEEPISRPADGMHGASGPHPAAHAPQASYSHFGGHQTSSYSWNEHALRYYYAIYGAPYGPSSYTAPYHAPQPPDPGVHAAPAAMESVEELPPLPTEPPPPADPEGGAGTVQPPPPKGAGQEEELPPLPPDEPDDAVAAGGDDMQLDDEDEAEGSGSVVRTRRSAGAALDTAAPATGGSGAAPGAAAWAAHYAAAGAGVYAGMYGPYAHYPSAHAYSAAGGYDALQYVNAYLSYGPAAASLPPTAATAGAAAEPPPAAATAAAPPLPLLQPAAPKPRKEYRSEAVLKPVQQPHATADAAAATAAELRASASPTPPPLDLLNLHRMLPPDNEQSTYGLVAEETALAPAAGAAAAKRKAEASFKPSSKRSKLSGKVGAMVQKWSAAQRQMEEEEERLERKAAEALDPGAQERKRLAEVERWKQEQLQTGAAEANANFMPVVGDWRTRFAKTTAKQAKKEAKADLLHQQQLAASAPVAAVAAASAATAADAPGAATKPKKPATKAAATGGGISSATAAAPASTAAALATASSAVASAVPQTLNFKTKPNLDTLSAGLPPGWRAMWDKSSGDVYYGNLQTKVRMRMVFGSAMGRRGGIRRISCYACEPWAQPASAAVVQ